MTNESKTTADVVRVCPECDIAGCRHLRAASLTAQAASAVVAVPSESEKAIRRLLCNVYTGALAYMDDGEAQDNRALPCIDFMRDSADEIQAKMQRRSLKNLSSAAPQLSAAAQEPWYGHKFKEVQRGVWRCACGKQLKEQPCTNGTPNTSLLPPDAAKQDATQMRGDGSPGPKALVSFTQAESSHDTHPAPPAEVPATTWPIAPDVAAALRAAADMLDAGKRPNAEITGSEAVRVD